jgi:type IV pilus secretin PilQ/predicted competence protein
MSMNFQNIEVRTALQILADFTGLNIITSDSVTGALTLRLHKVPWDQVLDIMAQAKGLSVRRQGNVIWVAPRAEVAAREKLEFESKLAAQNLEPMQTRGFALNYAKAVDVLTQIQGGTVLPAMPTVGGGYGAGYGGFGSAGLGYPSPASAAPFSLSSMGGGSRILSTRGSAMAESRTNQLFVTDIAERLDQVAQMIAKIDIPLRQVMIDAMIAEVTLNDSLRFGVQYFFETAGIDGIGADGRGGFSSGAGQVPSPTFPGFNFIMDTKGQARLALDALSQTTDVKVVSAPSVVVMENRSAILQVGDQVPVVTRQAQGVVNPDAPIVNQVEFRDTGVILNVTPRISADCTVTLDIEQEVSNVAATRGANPTLTPTIAQRRIASTVSVENGRTIALGGLIDEQRQDSKSGLPVLQDLPWIGRAFGNTQATTRRTELIVFITPRIITDGDDARALARDLADRMRHMQAGAIETPATPTPAPKPRRRR